MAYRPDEPQLNEYEREQEQMQKLDKLRKQILHILRTRFWFLAAIFVLVFAALLAAVSTQTKKSSTRYLARLTLCYNPKHKGKIEQYDDKYVLRILNRFGTKESFASQGNGRESKLLPIADKILIETDRKQPHTFTIKLYANSEDEAVSLINEFAAVCIRQYTAERTRDLQQWKAVLEEERKGVDKNLQEENAEVASLISQLQMTPKGKEYELQQLRLGELKNTRARIITVLKEQEQYEMELDAELDDINPMLILHQNELRAYLDQLNKLERKIFQDAQLYTEENPKMLGLITQRDVARKQLDDFLRENNIQSVDETEIKKAEELNAELKKVQHSIKEKLEEKKGVDSEIAECERRITLFNENKPKLEKLIQDRNVLQDSLKRLDESISDINYMLLMVSEDLFVNESAKSAVGNSPFSRKNMFISLFAAIVAASFIAVLTALIEFFFGKITDSKEMQLYSELYYLGVLPSSKNLFDSKDMEKNAFNAILHKFHQLDPHVVFASALPGAHILPQFFELLEWNFAMAGKKILVIDLVLAEEHEAPGDADENQPNTIIITFSGGKCFLPIASDKFLEPAEFELLKNDFAILKEQYDCIFIRHKPKRRQSKLFMEQIASLCDAALFSAGAGKTARKELRRLLTLKIKIKIPVMTILTEDAKENLNKDLNLEAES